MWRNILLEVKKLKMDSILALVVGLILVIGFMIFNNSNSMFTTNLGIWEFGTDGFILLLPLFASIPFCYKLFFEVREGYLKFINNRIYLKNYLRIKYISGALVCFLTIFLISFISLLIALYLMEIKIPSINNHQFNSFLAVFKYDNPFIYGFLLSLWRGFIGILFYTITYNLIFLSRNLFVVLTGGLVYYLLEAFVFGTLLMDKFSIRTTLSPDINAFFTFQTALIGILLILCFIIILTIFRKKKFIIN